MGCVSIFAKNAIGTTSDYIFALVYKIYSSEAGDFDGGLSWIHYIG